MKSAMKIDGEPWSQPKLLAQDAEQSKLHTPFSEGFQPLFSLDADQEKALNAEGASRRVESCCESCGKCWRSLKRRASRCFGPIDRVVLSKIVPRDIEFRERPDEWLRKATNLRRACRMFTAVLLNSIWILGACWGMSTVRSSPEAIFLSQSTPVYFSLQTCQLRIVILDTWDTTDQVDPLEFRLERLPAEGEVAVSQEIYIPGKYLPWNDSPLRWTSNPPVNSSAIGQEDSFHHFTMEKDSYDDRLEDCRVSLVMRRGTQIPGLWVDCEEACVVATDTFLVSASTSDYGMLNIGKEWAANQVVVNASRVTSQSSIVLGRLQTDTIWLHNAFGDIVLEDVDVMRAREIGMDFAESQIKADNGDVYFQTNSDMQMSWNHSTSLYCIASVDYPEVRVLSECNSTNYTTANCAGIATLCWNSTCVDEDLSMLHPTSRLSRVEEAKDLLPHVSMEVPRGSFYATRSFSPDDTTELSSLYGESFEQFDGVTVDDVTATELRTTIKEKLAVPATSNTAFVMLGPSNVRTARPGLGFLFVIVPSEAYAKLRPWWMSFLSWNLLMNRRRVETVEVRLLRGPCPYHPVPDESALSQIAKELSSHAQASTDNVVMYPMDNGARPGARKTFQFNDNYALRWPMVPTSEVWWALNQTQHEQVEAFRLASDASLLFALILALLICATVATLTVCYFCLLVSAAVQYFEYSGSHKRRYVEFARQGDSAFTSGDIDDDPNPGHAYALSRPLESQSPATPATGQPKSDVEDEDEQAFFDPLHVLLAQTTRLPIVRLPPIFGIIDHVTTIVQKRFENSLQAFVQLPEVREDDNEFSEAKSSELLYDFKREYSRFCFVRQLKELNVQGERGKKILRYYGLEIQPVPAKEQPDVFTHVRFKTARELERQKSDVPPQQLPGETSLDFFLRIRCKLTRFDADTISVDHFKSTYIAFCEERRILDAITVSKALMQHHTGIGTTKKRQFRVVPLRSSEKRKRFNLARAEKEVSKLLLKNSHTPQEILFWGWSLVDFFTVCGHTLYIAVICFPYFWVTFWIADLYSPFATQDLQYVFAYSDFFSSPRYLYDKSRDGFPLLFQMTIGSTLALEVCAWCQLLIYYSEQTFPIDTQGFFTESAKKRSRIMKLGWNNPVCYILRMSFELCFCFGAADEDDEEKSHSAYANSQRSDEIEDDAEIRTMPSVANHRGDVLKGVRKNSKRAFIKWLALQRIFVDAFELTFHYIQWCFVYAFVWSLAFLCTSFLIWCLLSALINPEAFLAYAAMAATLVTGVIGKYHQLKKLWAKNLDEIINTFMSLVQEKVNHVIKTMTEGLVPLGDGTAVLHSVGHVVGAVAGEKAEEQFNQHAMMLGGTSLGKNIVSAGFDVGLMLKLASGDHSAIAAFAEQHGFPEEIGHLMTQLAYGNGDGVVRAISTLLEKNQHLTPIAPELAVSLAELAFAPSRAKAEKLVRAMLHHGLPAMMKMWSSQVMQGSSVKLDKLNSLIRDLASEDATLDVMAILKAVHTETDPEKREAALREHLLHRLEAEGGAKLKKREAAMKTILELAGDASLRDAGMATAAALTGNPAVAKLGMLVGTKMGVPPQSRKKMVEMTDALLLDVLPTLLKGFVQLITQNDYQEFVVALRYVHNYLMDQKQLILSTFGPSFFKNLELTRPIFHVLDLLLAKGQYQDAILEFLQDESVLNLPKEVTLFVKICVWLRVPSTKQDLKSAGRNPLQAKYLTSYSDRTQAVKAALEKLNVPKQLHILVNLLVAFALDDFRSMTHSKIGRELSDCVLFLADFAGLDEVQHDLKVVLADCFEYAFAFMTALNLGQNMDMFKTLQNRTGLVQEHMQQVVDLYTHTYSNPLEPPKGMTEWHLMRAASSLVGLELEEAVGLAHLCMGHTDSREATSFIRELLRRQHIAPDGADRFVKNMLAISLATHDQGVMYALQELRIRSRFLSIMGLGYAPPRYFSEILLRNCGIVDPEVLLKRLEVPFKYKDGPDEWEEWLEKAKCCIEGKPVGKWFHLVEKASDTDHLPSNNILSDSLKPRKGMNAIEESLKKRRAKKVGRAKSARRPCVHAATDQQVHSNAFLNVPGQVHTDADLEKGVSSYSVAARTEELEGDQKTLLSKQLEWRTGNLTKESVEFFVKHFNDQAKREYKRFPRSGERKPQESLGPGGSSIARFLTNPLTTASDALHANLSVKRNYEEKLAERLLLQEQDTSTGILRPLTFTQEQYHILAKIMSFKTLVRPHEKDSANRRNMIIQDFADMLGVGSRELTTLFDLVRPEQTKQARIAIEVLGRSHFPEGVTDALSQTVYNVKRTVQIFDDIRSKLWEISHRFHLPRFLGAATLLPHMSYPPQFREVGSIVHSFMAPVLANRHMTASVQAVLYEVMGLTTGAPSNSENLSRAIGLFHDGGDKAPTAVVQTMVMSGISDKLESIGQFLGLLLPNMPMEVQESFKDLLPFLLFFAGFPYAELPPNLRSSYGEGTRNVMQEIHAKTKINERILSGIDLSIWSISPFSKSDEGKLNRESVLGLILPLFEDNRVRFRDLPNDGLVKAIVSLAYCAVDHLEFLAEAMGLDTFVTQLLVHLVRLSQNNSNSIHVNQIAQRIRVNAGIVQKLSVMGVPGETFLSLLMLSFPNVDDMPAVPGLLERVGLHSLGVEVQWAELFYALAVCSLNHLDRNCDPSRHLQLTKLLKAKLEPLLPTLGFQHDLVPTLAARLLLGDFYVIGEEEDNELMKLLLPFELERELAESVCGLLSHAPPQVEYRPAVVSGIVTLSAPKSGEVRIRARSKDPLPAGNMCEFAFRMLLDGVEVDQTLFKVTAEEISVVDYDDTELGSTPDLTPYDAAAAQGRTHKDFPSSFTIVVRVLGSRARLPEETSADGQLDIWWRAYPPVEKLADARRSSARSGLRELEKLCWWERLHWGGVANSWWDGPLDLHPLIILLAAGDYKAVQLASDLLGVPDIVISYLFAHVISAPIEKLRPLLLSDLCSEPIIERAARKLNIPVRALDPPPIKRDENVRPVDRKMRPQGYRYHPNNQGKRNSQAADESANLLRDTSGFSGVLSNANIQSLKLAVLNEDGDEYDGLTSTALEGKSMNGDKGEGAQDDLEPGQTSPYDEELDEDITSRPVTSHGRAELQHASSRGSLQMGVFTIQKNPFAQLGMAHFPDELSEIYSTENEDAPDGGEHDIDDSDPRLSRLLKLVGDAPWLHWHQENSVGASEDVGESPDAQEPKLADLHEGYQHSISEFCFSELKKCMGAPHRSQISDTVLDEWLTQYAGIPFNIQLFLSMLLYKLFMLLDDDRDQTEKKVRDRMPTVSLVLFLTKIHQLRYEVCHRYQEKKTPKPAAVMFHMLPAMWGLETHLRRTQSEVRKNLRKEVEKKEAEKWEAFETRTGKPWNKEAKSKFKEKMDNLQYGRVAGFGKPDIMFSLPEEDIVDDDIVDVGSAVDWKWSEWKWPEDPLVSMCSRLVQVARLTLGVAKPLECWHPLDDPADLSTAIASMHRNRRERGEMQLFDNRIERGWVPLKDSDSGLSRTLSVDMTRALSRHLQTENSSLPNTDQLLETSAVELRADLLDGSQLRRLFVCTMGGIDPYSETSSFKSLTWAASDYANIKGAVDLYAAFHGLVSTRFRSVDDSNMMPCTSDFFQRRLGPSDKGVSDGACRVAFWSKKISVELGVDCSTLEAMVNVAHGYIGGTDPSTKESVLNVLATRLRMPTRIARRNGKDTGQPISGALVLQQLCTKEWDLRSCKILAEYLGIAPQIVSAIIEASDSQGDNQVQGWIKLQKYLYPPAKDVKDTGNRFDTNQGLISSQIASSHLRRGPDDQVTIGKSVGKRFGALFKRGADDADDEGLSAQKRMMKVLVAFDKEHKNQKRNATAMTQKGWLASLVKKLLEQLTETKPSKLVLDMSALILHLLSGQNVAAGVVLRDNDELREAAGLTGFKASSLLNLAYLTKNRGELRLLPDEIEKISQSLAEPLLDRIFELQRKEAVFESAIPKDAVHEWPLGDNDEEIRTMIKERLVMCLDCMLGMAVKDNQRVLDSIRRLMELAVRRVAEKALGGKLLLESDDNSKLKMFARWPVDANIVQLMKDEPAVRQYVLVQSLQLLDKLRFNSKKRIDTKTAKGSQTLNKMANAMFKSLIQRRRHEETPKSTFDRDHSGNDLFGTMKLDPLNQTLDPLNQTSSFLDKSFSGVKSNFSQAGCKQTLGSDRQQARNAMQYFFIGIAMHGQKACVGEVEAWRLIWEYLPLLASAATGRLDQFLDELKKIALEKGSKHAKDIGLVIDLLCLLGVDEGVFKNLRKHLEHNPTSSSFLSDFLDHILQYVDASDELKMLVRKLLELMVAICVGVPPTELAAKQKDIFKPVQDYLIKWLEKSGDRQYVNAAKALVELTTKMINRAFAEKRSLHYVVDEDCVDIESKILDASLDLLLPFIPQDMREPLSAVLALMSELKKVADNPGHVAFKKYAPIIIEHMSTALCVPKANVKGVIALSQGDWAGAVELCKPFCNLDPDTLRQLSQLLPSVQKSVVSAKDKVSSVEGMAEVIQINSHFAGRVEQITTDALNNKGTPEELFELLDVDRNGHISQEEFRLLMDRLDFPLNEHRIIEIMSSCKKPRLNLSKSKLAGATETEIDAANGLDLEEFKEALKYLQSLIAMNAMQNLNIAWPRLMFLLIVFGALLVMLFLFIAIGMNAFVSSGVFSSVVNSVLTIATGLGGFKLVKAGGTDTDKKDGDNKHAMAAVQDVKATFFSNT